MKSVTVPFSVSSPERVDELFSDRMVKVCKQCGAQRLSLVFKDEYDIKFNTEIILRAIKHFKKYRIEVIVWLNSLLHIEHKGNYTPKKYADGTERGVCPFDDNFARDYAKLVAEYAKTGVSLIYLDDDFRISASGGINCFCDLHMKEYRKIFGDGITKEKIAGEILSGKPNAYRDAWAKINGDALRNLARTIRDETDKVDPAVRIGICASPPTMFGTDGVTAFELSNILAGKTTPFLRTIGAPYWSYWVKDYWKASLNDIIGMQRLEAHFAEISGFNGELVFEGDTYPRPRYFTPASYLESFHSALCTEDRFDGILKYIGEYTCRGTYETGYSKAAGVNKRKTGLITDAFKDTVKVGYRIFETQNKMRSMEFDGEDIEYLEHGGGVPASVCAMNGASMPYTFCGDEPVVVFGDNVRYLSESDYANGIITDIVGANILAEKGIDVGYISCNKKSSAIELFEYYSVFKDKAYVNFKRQTDLFELKFKEKAEILTYCTIKNEEKPLTYRYENNGLKIVVCCVDMGEARFALGFFNCYYKQRILADCYKWFKGEELAATCFDSPMLMPIIGKKDKTLVIGLWNIFEDRLFNYRIILSKKYDSAKFIGCSGKLNGKNIILKNLNPFDYCAIVLSE